MKKISFLLMITLVASSIPFAFAHPDIVGVLIDTPNGAIPDNQITGIKKDKQESIVTEILTEEWIYQNFFWILIGTIAGIISIAAAIEYRKEIFRTIKI